jgi:hypothetical protein
MTFTVDWIIGFIDGDGSFALDKVGRNFYRPSLRFNLKLVKILYKG